MKGEEKVGQFLNGWKFCVINMEIKNLDFSRNMDLELSKNSFPYFFTEVLGFEFTAFHQEWLDLMNTTDRTVVICSRHHGKSVLMHSWAVW